MLWGPVNIVFSLRHNAVDTSIEFCNQNIYKDKWRSLMKHNRNPLAKAISYALGAGMIASLARPPPRGPPRADGEEDPALDRLRGPGCRIPRVETERPPPVTVVDRQGTDFW